MSTDPQKATLNPVDSLILASGSPRRKELLSTLLKKFKIITSEVEELQSHQDGPVQLVMENAKIKTLAVAKFHPSQWVLGADTLVALGDQVFGKPKDLMEAKSMLLQLSGKKHHVHTGVSLINISRDVLITESVSTLVTFKKLVSSSIDLYFTKVNPLDKAGAYGIQSYPEMIVDSFEGSLSNVIGLPLELVREWLNEYLSNSMVG
jgi:septum formation protein